MGNFIKSNYLYRLLKIPRGIQKITTDWITPILKIGWGSFGKGSYINPPIHIENRKNLFLGDHVRIMGNANILNLKGRVFIKDGSGAAANLTIVTDNHSPGVGETYYGADVNDNLEESDIIIDEDVWVGINVTILSNVHICRGAIVGGGAVLRNQKIPPYAIVIGNPAKVIGFRFTPEEIYEHEKLLYPESKRISESEMAKNYEKFFLNRIKDIKNQIKL